MRRLWALLRQGAFLGVFLVGEAVALWLLGLRSPVHQRAFLKYRMEAMGFFHQWAAAVREWYAMPETIEQLHRQNAMLLNALAEKKFTNSGGPGWPGFFLPAEVVALNLYTRSSYLLLYPGARMGIQERDGVVAVEGIVGIVSAVSADYALVLPVAHPDVRVSVRVGPQRLWGTLQGNVEQPYEAFIEDIPLTYGVRQGDTVWTSGAAGVFPPGWLVGQIIQVDTLPAQGFLRLKVHLLTPWHRLSRVFVYHEPKERWDSLGVAL